MSSGKKVKESIDINFKIIDKSDISESVIYLEGDLHIWSFRLIIRYLVHYLAS
jgi:hypothetical protein